MPRGRPRGDPEKRHVGVGASVDRAVKDFLIFWAVREKTTIGKVAGGILTDWVYTMQYTESFSQEMKEQYIKYRREQTPKPPKVRKYPTIGRDEYRKGKFGKIKEE